MNRIAWMKRSLAKIVMICLMPGLACAKDEITLLRPEERAVVDAQSEALFAALEAKLAPAAQSTVRVWSGENRLAYGTVIGDGRTVLTKWSEVAKHANTLVVDGPNREAHDANIVGVYEDEDLAILEIAGNPLTPVTWSNAQPPLGAFLIAPQPDGRPAAFGVVSVLERNLRETDFAFLGIESDLEHKGPGVRIKEVQASTPAEAAGLKPGDIVLAVKDRPISGLMELKSALTGAKPGETVALRARVGGKEEKKFNVTLSQRPELPKIYNPRLTQMERMGGKVSSVRDSFTRVVQSDMRLEPDQIGGPVVDLQGRVIGISVAHADRTRSFIMPSAAVTQMLANAPKDPTIAKVREPEKPIFARAQKPDAPRAPKAPSPRRLREHLSEMERLMEFMREEMRALEFGP
ncbi:MAG: trypsin-like peptidase domain-containing protein [Luteolibacter sp.]